MAPRLAAGVAVSALIRRVAADGGAAMVLARGDATAGAILLLLSHRGVPQAVVERLLSGEDYGWAAVGPADPAAWGEYLDRRRARDPDLWVVELDHPDGLEVARAIG